jgi:hypothetical protein
MRSPIKPAGQIPVVSPIRTLACLTIALAASTRGALAQCPPPATTFIENPVAASGRNATVGIRDCGEFIVAFERPLPGGKPHI